PLSPDRFGIGVVRFIRSIRGFGESHGPGIAGPAARAQDPGSNASTLVSAPPREQTEGASSKILVALRPVARAIYAVPHAVPRLARVRATQPIGVPNRHSEPRRVRPRRRRQ